MFIVGVPRSGTTWVARVLARGTGARYLEEPDNHFRFGFALRAKAALGQRGYPQLEPGGTPESARDYARLWHDAFQTRASPLGYRGSLSDRLVSRVGHVRASAVLAGASPDRDLRLAMRFAAPRRPKRGDGPVLVKSVYATLAVEWIASRHDVEVVVTARHPLNIVSSWQTLGWLDESGPEPLATLDPMLARGLGERFGVAPPSGGTPIGRAAWLVGVLTRVLDEAIVRNPSWHRVVHEDLCRAPIEGFHRLAADLGLPWDAAGDRAISGWNRPGDGYETHRVAAELPDLWESRLRPHEIEEATAVLAGLEMSIR